MDFLKTLLDETGTKKEEPKEATGTGGGSGPFVTKMGSTPNEYVNKVPTVRESKDHCDSCNKVMSKCTCKKPKKIDIKRPLLIEADEGEEMAHVKQVEEEEYIIKPKKKVQIIIENE